MRTVIILTIALGLGTATSADTMKNCAAGWKSMSAADQAKTTYKAYAAMCLKSSYTVPASSGAMAAQPPAGATGKCKDGTWTTAATHQGACSHHGGVASWLPDAPR